MNKLPRPPAKFDGVNRVVLGRKFCTGCGRWRPIHDYAHHTIKDGRVKLQTRCRACVRTAHKQMTPDQRARRREYQRQYQERARRRAGSLAWEEWVAQRYERERFFRAIILGRKNCLTCGRWRPVSDYGHNRGRIASTCLSCRRKAMREQDRRRRRNAKWVERRREYDRIYKEAKRREAGVKPRNLKRAVPADPPNTKLYSRLLDPEPLREAVRAYVTRRGGMRSLLRASGVPERRVYELLHERSNHVHYVIADKLATAMGLHIDLIYMHIDDEWEDAA